ncbi:histidine--tRNA ligase [Candidatus Woesearchaeota archaeon]|jgi:histidyl-tRNA synthetase|nr:histidine--tRNA ligase [Candidatus Woesearchaeota archaeon]MBT6045098.1 histidine--tRNA ligase [Candidatus Woesearchaeota archaeon]
MELKRAKGTRDFLPEEKISRNEVVDILKGTFERYGFNPLETPSLEMMDVLGSKYAGGAEILKETFNLKDQGGRELGLRYDLTVPFARVIAMNKGLRMPFKRYAIDRVFRDGPLKLGRYREFWQCDVDVVGCNSFVAEVELFNIAKDVFSEIGLDVVIKVNDRRLLDAVIENVGVDKDQVNEVILVIDKLEKVGVEAVKKELIDSVGIDVKVCDLLLEIVLCKGSNQDKLKIVSNSVKNNEGFNNLDKIFSEVDFLEFSPSLARGLTYYTGTVFEVFLKDRKVRSSLSAGGRYDKLIGDLVGDGREYPAVGISFGLDVINEALKIKNEGKESKKTVVDIYVVSIGCSDESRKIVQKFRSGKLKVDIDLLERGVSKNLDYASKAGIKYVVFVGKKELEAKKVKLKNMVSGDEKMLTVNECFKFLTNELIH